MSGAKSGVATRLSAAEPRAVFTHCYGHSLNLACVDTIKRCKKIRDALDTTREITKLIKRSPARNAIFKRLKEELASESPGIRVLCPTRWTVRPEALKSILDNFNVLLEVWTESLERVKDTEVKARIQGVAAQMMKFDYFFGVSLGLLILRHTDNPNRMMQKADMSAAEGQVITAMTVSTLSASRKNASFDLFWQKITASAENLQIDHPTLPRRRKAPRRLDDGTAPQSGYKTYANVQALHLKAAGVQSYQEELQFVLVFYGTDFDSLLLPTHLEIFSNSFPAKEKVILSDILNFFRICTPGQLELMSQVS